MSITSISDRYDEFQKDAVKAISKDFLKKSNGRYLLVIPTGGGKTYTAVKAVCTIFDEGILDVKKDKVFWTAHRDELKTQAIKTFTAYLKANDSSVDFDKNIIVEMLSQSSNIIDSDNSVKLVVIDEAHHSAAKSYHALFDKLSLGILGLTATPSRHDGMPLNYEKESFSIGFPDLVKKGIILKPEIETIQGETYEIADINKDADLEQLDNEIRNNKIIKSLISNEEKYKKVIIYVGTKNHAKNLYERIMKSKLVDKYESISYVLGGGVNSRSQDRVDYIDQEKEYKRSIIINVQVLTEGYDDPTVNTVVMATPSKSKLYYMQSIGRAIRCDPCDSLKKSYVVEVVDDLPNIRYRIDNRWLYSDISDALEPIVDDRTYTSEENLIEILNEIYLESSVPDEFQQFPKYDADNRYSLLLFNVYFTENDYKCFPLLIDNHNRTIVSSVYNFLSERLAYSGYGKKEINYEQFFRMAGGSNETLGLDNEEIKMMIGAMENASKFIIGNDVDSWIKKGKPWIKYVSFSLREPDDVLTDELLSFIEEMINKESIIESLLAKNYQQGDILIKLPLPLKNYIGKIINEFEFEQIDTLIKGLVALKCTGEQDHRSQVDAIIGKSSLPLEIREANSLVIIARESLDYSIKL